MLLVAQSNVSQGLACLLLSSRICCGVGHWHAMMWNLGNCYSIAIGQAQVARQQLAQLL